MQENKFEKEVQQSMDELRLNPSDAVWNRIEAAIIKKKTEKKVGWIISLLVAGLLGSILSWNYFTTRQALENNSIKKTKTAHEQTVDAVISTTSAKTVKKSTIANNTDYLKPLFDKNLMQKNEAVKDILNISKQVINYKIEKDKKTQPSQKNPVDGSGNNTDESFHQNQKNRAFIKGNKNIQISKVAIETVSNETEENSLNKMTGNINKQNVSVITTSATIDLNNTLFEQMQLSDKLITGRQIIIKKQKTAANKTSEKRKKIALGISFAAGRAATSGNYLGNIANPVYYDYLAAANNSSIPGGSVSNKLPSPVEPGIGFNIGLQAVKNISRKSTIAAGVSYQQMNTSIRVGMPVTNAQGKATFSTGKSNGYNNRYHFIQLPVDFSTQFTNFKRHNLFFNAGFSVAQLIQTNALQFDNIRGQYEIDNTKYNKTTAALSTGVSINLSKNADAPLLLGTDFYYSITPIASKGLYANSRYSFLGVRLQKTFAHK